MKENVRNALSVNSICNIIVATTPFIVSIAVDGAKKKNAKFS